MRKKYILSAITIALLGINNNQMNSVSALQAQTQTTAKLTATAQVAV